MHIIDPLYLHATGTISVTDTLWLKIQTKIYISLVTLKTETVIDFFYNQYYQQNIAHVFLV